MVQKATLRRAVFGIVWFMVLSYGLLIGGMMLAVAALPAGVGDGAKMAAQTRFAQSYGPYIFFGSLTIAIVGTVGGFLPGTRKEPR